MVMISVVLLAAGLGCLMMAWRGVAVTMLMAAAGFWLLPQLDGTPMGGQPSGFAFAAEPAAAPAARFKAASGQRLSLADFRGKVVLLNIWATWCGPCREEMPSLDRLQALHRDDGLAVVAVSVESDGTTPARRFFEISGIRNLPLYIDSGRSTQSAFGARAIPMSVLIDRNGMIVGQMVGSTEWDSPAALALVRRYLEG